MGLVQDMQRSRGRKGHRALKYLIGVPGAQSGEELKVNQISGDTGLDRASSSPPPPRGAPAWHSEGTEKTALWLSQGPYDFKGGGYYRPGNNPKPQPWLPPDFCNVQSPGPGSTQYFFLEASCVPGSIQPSQSPRATPDLPSGAPLLSKEEKEPRVVRHLLKTNSLTSVPFSR